MPLLFTCQYYSQWWNEAAAAQLEVTSTHRPLSTRVVDARTENKCRWQSIDIITRRVMQRRNIHSLLTLAAEPSKPSAGAAAQPRGRPISQGRWGLKTWSWALNGKAQPGSLCRLHLSGRKGLLVWSLPSLCCRKRVKCTFARASNTTFRSHQDQF